MSISPELMYAILSMDAYNRGYGAGIGDAVTGLGESGQIGTATLKTRAELGISETQYQEWQAAGFYAVAYEWTDAETTRRR